MAGKAKEDDDEKDMVVVEEEAPEEKVPGEIDSSSEDEKEKEKEKPQLKKPVRKRGNDNQKQINALWMKRKEAEETANREAQRANLATAKNTEYEKITASALEENLNTKRELLTERLMRAQEAGDAKKVAEITTEQARIEAQSAQMERYKLENQVNPQQQRQQVQQREEQPVAKEDMYEQLSPAGKKWMDDNKDWYDEEGENHDPERVSDVTYYAQKLEKQLLASGNEAEIGTKAYFNKINDYIKQNWSENMQDETEENDEELPIQQKKSYAAPVGNRNAQQPSNNARKEYKISQSEKEMALALNMKDSKGNSLSDAEKIKRFVSLRETVPPDGPISMKTMKKGV